MHTYCNITHMDNLYPYIHVYLTPLSLFELGLDKIYTPFFLRISDNKLYLSYTPFSLRDRYRI